MTFMEATAAADEYAAGHGLSVVIYGRIGHEDYGWCLEPAPEEPEGWQVAVRPAVMSEDGWHIFPAEVACGKR